MTSDITLSRRTWLGSSLVALGGLALDSCATTSRPARPISPVTAGIAHLDLNESPFGASPAAIRAIENELHTLGRYTGDEAAALVAQIAALEQVPTAQVILGEVLEPLGALVARQPGTVVYSTPGYTALADAAQTAGGTAVGVPLDDRLENDLGALRATVDASTRALFVVNPHNPSGTVTDTAAFHAFVSEMAQRTIVIVDEAYLEYADDAAARTAVVHTRANENVCVFRTFSKIHGLAALPFGYAVLPTSLAAALDKRGVGHPRSLDRLAVLAAGASLRDSAFIAGVRERIAAERALWSQLFVELGVRHADARGNFVFFETGRAHAEVAAAMLARGVDIGRAFPPLDHWARISIGLPADNTRARTAVRDLLQR